MARLDIRLLGGFSVTLADHAVTQFESDTVRGLLARLAAAPPGHTVARPALAELLWPDRPPGAALANLRHALTVLRRAIGDHDTDRPYLIVHPGDIGTDPSADVRVDVAEFHRLASASLPAPGTVEAWEDAVALWRGSFLHEVDIEAGEQWDDWVTTTRAHLEREAAETIGRLAELRERTGEHDDARRLARQWTELDPWDERAHRLSARLLAASGESAPALAGLERFATHLRSELGVEPSADTGRLADDIRAGRFPERSKAPPITWPADRLPPLTPFADRETELVRLTRRLEDAAGGAGGLLLVAGEAGSGKSMLLQHFASLARERMPGLLVADGRCNAYTGPGDPYLPFRQILGLLCGDLDRAWTTGAFAPAHANLIWDGMPEAVAAVLDEGPYLLGTLLDAEQLGARLASAFPDSPLLPRLQTADAEAALRASDPARRSRPMLDQYCRVVRRIAQRHPMLLLVDDLQWADRETIDLLFQLARGLAGRATLVLGAFRPEDITSEGGRPHPFEALVYEVRMLDADGVLELGDRPSFVDAWLDLDPNRLNEAFRDRLRRTTEGHALFTTEMVRAMRERGQLVRDADGCWVIGSEPSWELPPRVEATIGARLARLPDEVRAVLEAASVQGEEFLVEIVALVLDAPAAEVERRFASLAGVVQPLVVPGGSLRHGGTLVERYRFRHGLFQRYLYDRIGHYARTQLHQATGRALATRFAGREDEVVVELARHFDEAGLDEEAVDHYARAGRRAMALSADAEAIRHLERALQLLEVTGPSAEHDRRALGLLTALGACFQAHLGYTAPQTAAVYEQIRELAGRVGTTIGAAQALGGMITFDLLRARYADALEAVGDLVAIARGLGLPVLEAVAGMQSGLALLMTGRLTEADSDLRRVLDQYDPVNDGWLTYAVGQDVGVTARSWWSVVLWHLGDSEEASRQGDEAIATARRLGHPFSLAFALAIGGCLVANLRGQPGKALAAANEVAEIADREDFAFYRSAAHVHAGRARGALGDPRRGLDEMELGLAGWRALGTEAFASWTATWRAELQLDAGRPDDAAATLDELAATLEHGEEQIAELRLWLVRGRLLRTLDDSTGAEVAYRRAASLATAWHAAGAEREALNELAELLVDLGRIDERADDRPLPESRGG